MFSKVVQFFNDDWLTLTVRKGDSEFKFSISGWQLIAVLTLLAVIFAGLAGR